MSRFNRSLTPGEMALYWKACLGGVYFVIALFGGGAIYFLFIAEWMAALWFTCVVCVQIYLIPILHAKVREFESLAARPARIPEPK